MGNTAENNFLVKDYLRQLLSRQLSKEALLWIDNSIRNAGDPDNEMKTYQSFARIPMVTGKNRINFTDALLKEASGIRKGWNPSSWTTDQVARILLLISLPSRDGKEYKLRLRKFFDVADMNELETLCLGLPLYPFAEKHVDLALQGLRSNMKVVFEAIALNNPYPAEHFDIHAWNQMVLKALFVGSPIYKIHGVDERANLNLASMLSDYAHERWAAGRIVSPELWRCAGPFMNELIFKDIQRVLENKEEIQQEAGALACFMSKLSQAHKLLDNYAELKNKILNREIYWQAIGKKWQESLETVQKS